MDKQERNSLIAKLAEDMPPYVPNYHNFKPGDQILYSGPYFDHNEIEAAMKVLLTNKWISNGEYTARFQSAFARKFNAKHTHFVNSGSSANLVMIASLKKIFHWKDGDEVIVSPTGFPTTISPIVQNGLKSIFSDIEFNTLNFDLDEVERKITEKTVAIFVSPVLGNPPNMDKLLDICKNHNIQLILDGCDSLGTKWKDKLLGEYAIAWSCSFYVAHHMTTLEGGMVCSNNIELIEEVRSFVNWGRNCRCVGAANALSCGTCGNRFDTWLGDEFGIIDHKYVFTNIGYNLKPLDIQAAIGLEQLKKFDEIERLRKENFKKFRDLLLKYILNINIAWSYEQSNVSWFGVPIICNTSEIKNKLVQYLENHKIQTRNYFAGNLLVHTGYKHLDDYRNYPNANKALSHVFFVGCPPHYTDVVFGYIEDVLKKWVNV